MEDSLPWTPVNRPAKFDAANFILDREIRNCTNKKAKVTHITTPTTPCLLACVDNNTVDTMKSTTGTSAPVIRVITFKTNVYMQHYNDWLS